MAVSLHFVAGTLDIGGLAEEEASPLPDACRWDARTRRFRAPAVAYAEVVRALVRRRVAYEDQARQYGVLDEGLQVRREPRPFQTEALEAWRAAQGRGVVVLPTGAGKTEVALLAIDKVRRDTLVIAPTLDLVTQWHRLLGDRLRRGIGVMGGGDYRIEPVTVSTYDSAFAHMEHLGARFGLVVFDECHHLPGEAYALAARHSLAPYRLGLTATPERADGRHADLESLVGPIVYRRQVRDLTGDYLADYTVERIFVELTGDERREYDEARGIYREFVVGQGIRMSDPDGWSQFIIRSSQSVEGRRALAAYQRQKQLAFAAPSKLTYVEKLLHRHRRDPRPAVHRTQRVRLRTGAPFSRADHHPPDESVRTGPDPGGLRGRPLQRAGHFEGPQRGGGHARRQRGHRDFGQRIRARVRAAPRPHPPQAGREEGGPVRAGGERHLGGSHQRPPPGARC